MVGMNKMVNAIQRCLIVVFLIGSTPFEVLALVPDFNINREARFAHEREFQPRFKSVVLTLHGWGGNCNSTFSNDDGSLFSLFKGKQFFDFDCLDYKVFDQAFSQVASRDLHERLKLLADKGYEEVVFITHSTGGVVALWYIAAHIFELADKKGTASKDDSPYQVLPMKISGILAWAAPVNGVTLQIKAGAELLEYKFLTNIAKRYWDAGFTTEKLDQLHADSSLLQHLKSKLKRLKNLQNPTPLEEYVRNIEIVFYHGQYRDMVVKKIDISSPDDQAWLPKKARMINTETFHLHNISSTSDEIGIPTFPGELTDLNLQKMVTPKPLLEKHFPLEMGVMTDKIANCQLDVVNGVGYLATWNFSNTYRALLKTLKHIMLGSVKRSRWVDLKLIDGLSEGLDKTRIDASVVNFISRFAAEVLVDFSPKGDTDPLAFGGRERVVLERILNLAVKLTRRVSDAIRDDHSLEAELQPYQSLAEFQRDMIRIIVVFLGDTPDNVQLIALNELNRFHAERNYLANVAYRDSLESISNWAANNNHRLTPEYTTAVNGLLTSAVVNNPQTTKFVLESFSKPVRFFQKDRPLIARFINQNLGNQIIASIDSRSQIAASHLSLFSEIAISGRDVGVPASVSNASAQKFSDIVRENSLISNEFKTDALRRHKIGAESLLQAYPGARNQMLRNVQGLEQQIQF